jgi:hypothetical protein
MTFECDDCGDTTRDLQALVEGSVIRLLCHDEEKSCYLYAQRKLQEAS